MARLKPAAAAESSAGGHGNAGGLTLVFNREHYSSFTLHDGSSCPRPTDRAVVCAST